MRREIEHLERVVGEAEEAIADFRDREPPVRELRGIGAIVHDFYTGAERVFEKIAPELNGGIPLGSSNAVSPCVADTQGLSAWRDVREADRFPR